MSTHPSSGSEPGEKLPVYILAGGRSRRFGTNKARAEIGGVPMIALVAQTLSSAARSITVVAERAGAYDDLGLHTIGDVVPGQGPAGGVLTAIRHHIEELSADPDRGEWILVTACDWVGIRAEWVGRLLGHRGEESAAVVFRSEQLEPLLGLYHLSAEACLASAVASNRVRMQTILEEIPTVTVPAPEGWRDAVNVNRSSDLR